MQFFLFFHLFLSLSPLLLQLSSLAHGSAVISRTITVDQKGHGDFKTVQEAVNAVPDQNSQWVRIHVKQGIYWEKVSVASTKSYILLEGEGSKTTEISWNAHAHAAAHADNYFLLDTYNSATFTALANNFVARDITFLNTYNANDGTSPDQAVAALVGGDMSAFYNCGFIGYQDTLCDFAGRHYFSNCWIEGAVDFIFGSGQSIYENSVLRSIMPPGSQPGWVTAHARDANSSSGFVFKNCALLGTGREYLGRPWNQYATVVFYKTAMSNIVMPQGWDAWNVGANVSLVTFAEYGCTGAGSNTSSRVPWEKKLSPDQIASFIDIKFVDDSGWLSQQP